jgi:hypothetical protein
MQLAKNAALLNMRGGRRKKHKATMTLQILQKHRAKRLEKKVEVVGNLPDMARSD